MLRQRRPGGRSGGSSRRGDRVRAAEVPSDTFTVADILEYAEPRACLAPNYLILTRGEVVQIPFLRA
jgi:hypothetical protein